MNSVNDQNMEMKINSMVKIALDFAIKSPKSEYNPIIFLIKSKIAEFKRIGEAQLIIKVFNGIPYDYPEYEPYGYLERSILFDIADMPGDNLLLMKIALDHIGCDAPALRILEHACCSNNINIAKHLFETYLDDILKLRHYSHAFIVNELCEQKGYHETKKWYFDTVVIAIGAVKKMDK